ncbi:MAG TPA: hypothetical protein VNO26_08940 [Candidatus Limnocylindria bacterium]|nr:hypothetical protein [Candidatus Limnocylindria bacterium]
MITVALPLLLASLAATAAFAEPPVSCAPARLTRVESTASSFRLAATVETFLEPTNGGLALTLAEEPETAGAPLLEVSLPAEAFTQVRGGFRYRDPAGAIGGITDVRVRVNKRRSSVSVKGAALAPGDDGTGPLRLVVQSSLGCSRSCGAPCRRGKGRLRCKASPKDALCGLRSGCDPLGVGADGTSRACLLPYPSDFFTAADAGSETGRRIAYTLGAMPANASGTHVDPAPYNLLDGFSAGPVINVHFPAGVDLAVSRVPPPTDLAASLRGDSPTLLIEADAEGCRRVAHFGENDVSAEADGAPVAPPDQTFLIRPAVRLQSGTRYIVALRNLYDQRGVPIAPGPAFRAVRDGEKTKLGALEARRSVLAAAIEKLERECGVRRDELLLAWDFTTASDDSVQRYLLHMRDQTFAQLEGSAAPAFVVSSVEDDPLGDPRICRRVQGTFTVPLWTTFNGPGSVLNLDPATNLPVQNGVADDVPFTAVIPCSLIDPEPRGGRPIVYGHGLLGSRNEVTAGNLRTLANTYGFVLAATDWQGFSSADLGTVLDFLGDLSGFPKLSERLHQGVLNQLVLARLMVSPAGFAAHPAFRVGATPLIDTTEVYWYGISQGGIEGGVVMALAQDITRGVLGVPAANYSTLLHRSVDFTPFFAVLRATYPDAVTRSLLLGLIQQLWDRSEPNGWYHHTIPGTLPDTPPHRVLVHMARSDAEVANLGTTIMVRSMGMPQLFPVNEHYVGIAEAVAPFDGSAMVESHFGLPDPPVTNTPPAENDVHGQMRALPAIQAQIDRFLRPDGRIEQFCSGPCDPD